MFYLTMALQSLLHGVVSSDDTIPGAALYIEAPRFDLSWGGASGVTDFSSATPLTPEHPVRIASITKTFTAAAVLRLWEENQLGLDDPITDYLPKAYLKLLTHGGYQPHAITIRHLLTHTSGLFDYTTTERFRQKIQDPAYRFTRIEQVQDAMAAGAPYGEPGEVFCISDTGSNLLGEILEQVTGLSFASALRRLVNYDQLGLTSTWHESMEEKPTGVKERVHQYTGNRDYYDLNPSYGCYGGGGLVCTMADVARFIRGVFTGQVYKHPETIEQMLTTISAQRGGPPHSGLPQKPGVYRLGIEVWGSGSDTIYIHTGYWGTLATYVPSLDVAISASVNQNQTYDPLAILHTTTLAMLRAWPTRE